MRKRLPVLADLTARQIDALSRDELREILAASPDPEQEPEQEPEPELEYEAPKPKDDDAGSTEGAYSAPATASIYTSCCSHILKRGHQCSCPISPYSGDQRLCGLHFHIYLRSNGLIYE